MRALCLITVLGLIATAAQTETPVPVEQVSPTTQAECDIAVAVGLAGGDVNNVNIYPILEVYKGDTRPEIDCTATFKAAGFPDYVENQSQKPVHETLEFYRPTITDNAATIDSIASTPPGFFAIRQYSLVASDGGWKVSGAKLKAIT